jgi:diacylglycerol O-acyltransferase / wax synthase
MQQLSAQDTLLAYGQASGWPLHLAVLQVYDTAGAPRELSLECIRELCRQRLPHLPVFRHRLARMPGGLGRPVWVEDPQADVGACIHGVRVPAPGTDHQLAEVAAHLNERTFDLRGPLWEMWVIEGLAGGRVAVLTRLHHAAVDGVRGLEIQAALLDLDPAAPFVRPGEVPGAGQDAPGSLQLLTGAAAGLAGTPVRLMSAAGQLARAAGRLADAARQGRLAGLTLPFTAPATSLNGPVSQRQGYAFCSLSLAAVQAAARQEHVTVNEVVLALTGGALRRYLDQRGELPGRSLTAAVPVGLPSDGMAWPGGGNRWAVMVTSLGTDVADPARRLHAVAGSARAAKAAQRAIGPQLWLAAPGVPPVLVAAAARGYRMLRLTELHPAVVNVVVSSMRGTPFPLYFAGARLLASYPVGPLADGLGLNISIVSYRDSLDFGLAASPDRVADPWQIAAALRAEEAGLTRRYGPDRPS